MTGSCDRCDGPAVWLVYAAYDMPGSLPHPLVARYPAAAFRLCSAHLPEYLRADEDAPNGTRMWVVTPS